MNKSNENSILLSRPQRLQPTPTHARDASDTIKKLFFIITQKQLYNPSNLNFSQKMGLEKCKIVICDSDHRETNIISIGTLELLQSNLQIYSISKYYLII